jgi:glycosyltransferase involved in cell wall biosynthesis
MQGSRKLRILLVTLRADYGGGPEHVFQLIKQLKDSVDFCVAAPKEEPYWNRYSDLVGAANMFEVPHRKFSTSKLFSLISFAGKQKVDLIHSVGKGGGVYTRLAGILGGMPVVHTFQGIHIGTYSSLQTWLYLRLEEVFGWFTARSIAVSQSEFDLVKKLNIVRNRNLRLVVNGVEIPETQTEKNANAFPRLIISVTRFDYQKNSEMTVQIMEILMKLWPEDQPKPELLFIGTGAGKESLKKLVQEKNLDEVIRFAGVQPSSQPWLAKGWCYLSSSRWEGLSLALQEAMSYALPVVATKVVGNSDAITHNVNGYTYQLDEPELAAQYLLRLLTDPAEYATKSKAAYLTAKEEYNVIEMAKQTKNIYIEVVG